MNVIVCIKQVPGTTEVKIDPRTNTLVRSGIKSIINPFDTYALEEGVRLREKHGGKVTVISMGPPQAEEALREAISLGADEAILLSDREFAGADTLATANTLSAAVRKIREFDLIVCGRQTVDGDTGQVGPEMAEMLDIPLLTYISQIEEIGGGRIRARRMVEEGYEIVETTLPALITVTKEINSPRLPSLRGIMKSKSAKIPVWTLADLGIDKSLVGLAGSATTVVKVFTPVRVRKAELIKGDPTQQVDALIQRLQDAKLV